ncbi:precorrin-8X methylmutase [Acetivibrio cellulolyticus]|uniref:precorrin-8X methylmutase n=1 Tax=Acetivibrio cellulolyticus TaxID=35830 RepID=UPI0019687A52|nr:precorrin-8X methylmutase [Acetivibrio cellulolyticus]
MNNYKPNEIEKKSFEIITEEMGKIELDENVLPIVKRVIHTTADFDYLHNLCFSENVINTALEAIKSGTDIVTDTNMALSGINKAALAKAGGRVYCFMADEDVAKRAIEQNSTRACASMEKAAELGKPLIFAVGNAPTALIKLDELVRNNKIKPALIIGVPVGFVNVVDSKELIMKSGVPYIVARGRKGGSNVAAAIVNALLYMAFPREN